MKFSQRIGLTPSYKEMQIESIDIELKNSLWNATKQIIIDKLQKYKKHYKLSDFNDSDYYQFIIYVWDKHYKLAIDEIPENSYRIEQFIRNRFYEGHWYETYDFIEFLANIDMPFSYINTIEYKESCNEILKREFSAFRFIGDYITQITNEYEIDGIESAINQTENSSILRGVNIHLKASIEKLSDKKSPDYRNSIKESISAVESIIKVISNNDKATISSAIGRLKNNIEIHIDLASGFKQLYNYTSDSSGIRHALMDNSNCDFDDAKYMLVSCSAFINYLIGKAQKAGII